MSKEHFNNFISRIKDIGLPTASRFQIILPKGDEHLSMLIDQCNLPGLSIMTNEMRTFGELREVPYGITYPPVQISAIVDNTSSTKLYFEDWANAVFNRNTRTLGYYDNYKRDVVIQLLNKNDELIHEVKLIEAYPKTISDIALDYSNRDIIRLQVSLAFRYWERTFPVETKPESIPAVPTLEEQHQTELNTHGG